MGRLSKILIIISLINILIPSYIGYPYILPPTQVIEIMAKKFSKIKSAKIIQITKVKGLEQKKESIFEETIYIMSPELYRSEISNQQNKRLIIHNNKSTLKIVDGEIIYDSVNRDFVYNFLLMANNPERLFGILKEVGINIEQVSLARFDEKIAYQVGETEEERPKLLIDKALFLPLLVRYGDVAIQFSDYRELPGSSWYPHRISYFSKDAFIEEYNIKSVTVNPYIDLSLFDIPLAKTQLINNKPAETSPPLSPDA